MPKLTTRDIVDMIEEAVGDIIDMHTDLSEEDVESIAEAAAIAVRQRLRELGP